MKILLVGEFSGVSTGYGKITRELAQRLHNDGYEIAELATFCHKDDPKIKEEYGDSVISITLLISSSPVTPSSSL